MSIRAALVCFHRGFQNLVESFLNFASIPGVVSKVNLIICVGGSILCFAPIYTDVPSNLENTSFAHLIRTSPSFRDASIASIALVVPNLLDVISDFVFVNEDQILTATLSGIDRFEKLFFSIGVIIPPLVIIFRDGLMKPTLVFVCALNCRDCLLFCIMIAFLSRHYSSSWTPTRSIWITLLFALSQIVNSFALNTSSGNFVSPSSSSSSSNTSTLPLSTAQQTLLWFSLLPFLITGLQWCYRIYLQSSNSALTQKRQSSGAAVIYLLSASSYILFSTWLAFRHVAEGKIDQVGLVASTFGYMAMTLSFLLLNLRRNKHEIVKGFDALNSKQTFLRYLSDEIKTPLRAVSYGMEQVSTKLEREQQQGFANDIQHLKSGCDSVLHVLDALVQFDKVHDGLLSVELAVQPFLPIVEQSILLFSAQALQKNIKMEIVLKDQSGLDRINLDNAITDIDELREFKTSVDREKIAHVIWNLLSNAIKYTPRGGKVTVIVGVEEHQHAHRRFNFKYDFNQNFNRNLTQLLNRRHNTSGSSDNGTMGLLHAADVEHHSSSSSGSASAAVLGDDGQDGASSSSPARMRNTNDGVTPDDTDTEVGINGIDGIHSVNLQQQSSSEGSTGAGGTGGPSSALALLQRRVRGRRRHFTVDVIDTGMGITMENQGKIFNEPVKMSVGSFDGGGGAGLGLYISKGIVDLHKGKITVKSNGIGTGSTFSLRVPIAEGGGSERGGGGRGRGRSRSSTFRGGSSREGGGRRRGGSFNSEVSETMMPDTGSSVDVLNQMASQLATSTISFLLPDNKDDDDDSSDDDSISDHDPRDFSSSSNNNNRRMSFGGISSSANNTSTNPMIISSHQFTMPNMPNFSFSGIGNRFRSLSMANRAANASVRLSGESPSKDLEQGKEGEEEKDVTADTPGGSPSSSPPPPSLLPSAAAAEVLSVESYHDHTSSKKKEVSSSTLSASAEEGNEDDEESNYAHQNLSKTTTGTVTSPKKDLNFPSSLPALFLPLTAASSLAISTPLPVNTPLKPASSSSSTGTGSHNPIIISSSRKSAAAADGDGSDNEQEQIVSVDELLPPPPAMLGSDLFPSSLNNKKSSSSISSFPVVKPPPIMKKNVLYDPDGFRQPLYHTSNTNTKTGGTLFKSWMRPQKEEKEEEGPPSSRGGEQGGRAGVDVPLRSLPFSSRGRETDHHQSNNSLKSSSAEQQQEEEEETFDEVTL